MPWAAVSTWYAPMCCVIPPNSRSATLVVRIASSSDVLPWSTWPMTVTTGGRGRRWVGSASSSSRISPSSERTSTSKWNLSATSLAAVAIEHLVDRGHDAELEQRLDHLDRLVAHGGCQLADRHRLRQLDQLALDLLRRLGHAGRRHRSGPGPPRGLGLQRRGRRRGSDHGRCRGCRAGNRRRRRARQGAPERSAPAASRARLASARRALPARPRRRRGSGRRRPHRHDRSRRWRRGCWDGRGRRHRRRHDRHRRRRAGPRARPASGTAGTISGAGGAGVAAGRKMVAAGLIDSTAGSSSASPLAALLDDRLQDPLPGRSFTSPAGLTAAASPGTSASAGPLSAWQRAWACSRRAGRGRGRA